MHCLHPYFILQQTIFNFKLPHMKNISPSSPSSSSSSFFFFFLVSLPFFSFFSSSFINSIIFKNSKCQYLLSLTNSDLCGFTSFQLNFNIVVLWMMKKITVPLKREYLRLLTHKCTYKISHKYSINKNKHSYVK